jgi:hypothetical protein
MTGLNVKRLLPPPSILLHRQSTSTKTSINSLLLILNAGLCTAVPCSILLQLTSHQDCVASPSWRRQSMPEGVTHSASYNSSNLHKTKTVVPSKGTRAPIAMRSDARSIRGGVAVRSDGHYLCNQGRILSRH